MNQLTHALKPDVVDDVKVEPFAFSDLIKIDVPDTVATLCPEEVATPPVLMVVDEMAIVQSAVAAAPDIRMPSAPVPQALGVEIGEVARPVKKIVKRRSRFSIDDYITWSIHTIKYGAIIGVVGTLGYGIYATVTGIMSLVAAVSVPAVIGVVVALVLFYWISSRLGITSFVAATATALSRGKSKQRSNASMSLAAVALKPSAGTNLNTGLTKTRSVDPLAEAWLDKMRDPRTRQGRNAYRSARHPDDRCAVGWLLETDNPNGWDDLGNPSVNGYFHTSMEKVERLYGRRLMDDVIKMNDKQRLPLSKIADHVEDQLRRSGKL